MMPNVIRRGARDPLAALPRRPRALLVAAASVALLTAGFCDNASGARNSDLRSWTDDLAFRISTDPQPPVAREKILYKVIVRDKKSGQPIEAGEGRIFASSKDGANTWDALTPGPEPGSYYGTLNYITAGDWAIAIQFRRDSTQAIQRIDWMQGVRAARSPN
ncbi:MAG: hypothetical protein HYX65_00380 [Gemmatimonadetes bacterium]|nr:hypothetical protein [Gemmatimonadota bacterium]